MRQVQFKSKNAWMKSEPYKILHCTDCGKEIFDGDLCKYCARDRTMEQWGVEFEDEVAV